MYDFIVFAFIVVMDRRLPFWLVLAFIWKSDEEIRLEIWHSIGSRCYLL